MYSGKSVAPANTTPSQTLELLLQSARLLYVNGQTTEQIVEIISRLGARMGFRVGIYPRWGDLTVHIWDSSGTYHEIISVSPTGVNMRRVADTTSAIELCIGGKTDISSLQESLAQIEKLPAISLVRFASLAAAGAVALGVIFGDTHWTSLFLIFLSAGLGACVRRWLGKSTHNAFVQPFCAALLAGVIGAVAVRLQLSSVLRLVAVCPCMVLVPGPHVLNGAIDLIRGRIPLGTWRILFAGLVILVICVGLLLGLAMGGVNLPVSGPSHTVPIAYDVLAAGIAVAAYGTFFSMPWSTLPVPVVIGMVAHASRWFMISKLGSNAEIGALVACLVVGMVVTPIAHRLRFPFAAFAFASVVSLIPGVFIFRMAGGLVALATSGAQASPQLLLATVADGTTAMLIVLAMTFGLILPRMIGERIVSSGI